MAISTMFDVARMANGPDFLLAAAGFTADDGAVSMRDVIAVKGVHASSSEPTDDGTLPRAEGAGRVIPFLDAPFGGLGRPTGLLLATLLATIAVSLLVAVQALARAER